MTLWRIAIVLTAFLLVLPGVVGARSAPAPKTIPQGVLLDYTSEAPDAGRLVIRFSGAGKVIRAGHKARSFSLDASALCELRGRLRRAPLGVVHAPDGQLRDALFRLHRPSGRVGPFRRDSVRELLAFGQTRFAGRRLPEASVAQQRFLRYLDELLRNQ